MTKEAILEALKGCKTQDQRAAAILVLFATSGPDDYTTVFLTGIPGAPVTWEEVTPDHLLGRNCNGSIVEIQISA
jgi:hypothetical protein